MLDLWHAVGAFDLVTLLHIEALKHKIAAIDEGSDGFRERR
jgi:hypothetical protein